jgi:hypothetical protein
MTPFRVAPNLLLLLFLLLYLFENRNTERIPYSDSLLVGRPEFRIPVRVSDFLFLLNLQAGSEAHMASFLVGTGVFSPVVKRPGRHVDHSPPSSTEVESQHVFTF